MKIRVLGGVVASISNVVRLGWVLQPPVHTQQRRTQSCHSRALKLFIFGILTTVYTGSIAHAAVITRSFDELIQDSVEISAIGNHMSANFTPNFGVSLGDAAALGGYDHFNWVQVATRFPGSIFIITDGFGNLRPPLLTPFIDPPPGGINNQPADELPFYWDEGNNPNFDPLYTLENNILGGRVLLFDDIPGNTFVIPGVNFMSFTTTLAGVYSDASWDPLFSFSWKSDYNPLFDGDLMVNRNVEPFPPGGEGGILDVKELANPSDIDPQVIQVWKENGVVAVSEPLTIVIFMVGLLLISFLLIRRSDSKR